MATSQAALSLFPTVPGHRDTGPQVPLPPGPAARQVGIAPVIGGRRVGGRMSCAKRVSRS